MPRKRSQKQTRHQLERSDKAEAMLNELVPIGKDAALVDLVGWRDRQGNLRRCRATWDNGWSADLWFTLPRGGEMKLSSYSMKWHGSMRKEAA
ncbi:hypothetical protein [Novosphingobium huizhouense]|uniref:hypothetical protein n=1 Tax=Novosphingobium huizhouense TaxID=2866625 RepID=UPI001CD90245|nr:hypothetical protein [Novosphingobium huizhouense]